MSAAKLLQMSAVVIDLIHRVEAMPRAGEEATVDDCVITAGGGFNAMIAAKCAGMEVAYGGAHGTGLFADMVRRDLRVASIPLLQAQSTRDDQGHCVVLVDRRGERSFISREGADGMLDRDQIDAIDPAGFDWILLSGYGLAHAGSREALHDWVADLPPGPRLVFDPSPVVAAIPEYILARALAGASWISANADEAARLSGAVTAEAACAALAARVETKNGGVIVRCGSAGCWVARQDGVPDHVPGFVVDPFDTNGAGDTHIGAFMAALDSADDAIEAARYANAAAALSTTRLGPATAPTDSETRNFMNRRPNPEAGDRARQGGVGADALKSVWPQ